MPTQTAVIALAAAAAAALLWRRRRRRVPPPGPQQPPFVLDARMLDRVLSTIEEEILPQTKTQLAKGNKMFGAAVLDAFSGDTVVADEPGNGMPDPPRRGRGHRGVVAAQKAAAGVGVSVCCDARAVLSVRERDRLERLRAVRVPVPLRDDEAPGHPPRSQYHVRAVARRALPAAQPLPRDEQRFYSDRARCRRVQNGPISRRASQN